MNTTSKIFLGVVAVVVVGLASGYVGVKLSAPVQVQFVTDTSRFGATNYNRPISFDEGVQVDNTEVISGTGELTVAGGTKIKEHGCGTATWNPPSVASSGNPGTNVASTTVTVTGSVAGDVCGDIGLSSATTTDAVQFACHISSADTATVVLENKAGAAVDYATGTLRACYSAY